MRFSTVSRHSKVIWLCLVVHDHSRVLDILWSLRLIHLVDKVYWQVESRCLGLGCDKFLSFYHMLELESHGDVWKIFLDTSLPFHTKGKIDTLFNLTIYCERHFTLAEYITIQMVPYSAPLNENSYYHFKCTSIWLAR